MPRMRYPQQAFEEIKRIDPATNLTPYYIRRLIASGAVPSHKVGRRRLVDVDQLIAYLASEPGKQAEVGAIRPVEI